MFPVHTTPPEACAVPDVTGWVRVSLPGGGVCEVTRLPLVDTRHGMPTFARPNYRASRIVAAREKAYMLTTGLVDHICEHGWYIDPIIIRETQVERADRIRRGLSDAYALERMATREWAIRHDDAVMAALAAPANPWSGHPPVANAGKDWIIGAKPGRALNYGWDTNPRPEVTHMIQTLGTRHDEWHTDYSQTLRLVRPAIAGDDILTTIWNMSPNLRMVASSLGVAWDELTEPEGVS